MPQEKHLLFLIRKVIKPSSFLRRPFSQNKIEEYFTNYWGKILKEDQGKHSIAYIFCRYSRSFRTWTVPLESNEIHFQDNSWQPLDSSGTFKLLNFNVVKVSPVKRIWGRMATEKLHEIHIICWLHLNLCNWLFLGLRSSDSVFIPFWTYICVFSSKVLPALVQKGSACAIAQRPVVSFFFFFSVFQNQPVWSMYPCGLQSPWEQNDTVVVNS